MKTVELTFTPSTVRTLINTNQSFIHNVLTLVAYNNLRASKLQMLERDIETLTGIASKYKYRKSLSVGQNELVKKILAKYTEQLTLLFNKVQ